MGKEGSHGTSACSILLRLVWNISVQTAVVVSSGTEKVMPETVERPWRGEVVIIEALWERSSLEEGSGDVEILLTHPGGPPTIEELSWSWLGIMVGKTVSLFNNST